MKRHNSYYILIISTFFILVASCKNSSEIEDRNDQIELLKTENDSLRKITVLIDSMNDLRSQDGFDVNYWFNEEQDGKSFKALGIAEPESFIKDALDKKPQLIPLEAVLGGIMHFNKIQLLGSKWLIANYEDGHIQGKALYKYSINKGKEINFELIDSLNHE